MGSIIRRAGVYGRRREGLPDDLLHPGSRSDASSDDSEARTADVRETRNTLKCWYEYVLHNVIILLLKNPSCETLEPYTTPYTGSKCNTNSRLGRSHVLADVGRLGWSVQGEIPQYNVIIPCNNRVKMLIQCLHYWAF